MPSESPPAPRGPPSNIADSVSARVTRLRQQSPTKSRDEVAGESETMWPSRLSRLRPPMGPYHAVPTQAGSLFPGHGSGVCRRGVNFRLRVLLMICVGIVACVGLLNLYTKRERHFKRGSLIDGAENDALGSHLNRESAMIDRIRHGSRRGHPPVKLPHKIVHLDLKGAPLNVPYIKSVLPMLAKLGATGILIEYEDMFPYEGQLAGITARNAYSKADVQHILEAAKASNLIVIPLVQTFGHLEFVLKLSAYKQLREVAENPQAICPSRNGSIQLVNEMLRQVITLHKGHSTHIHVGNDEVFVLGECDLCQKRMAENSWSKDNLLINHVTSIVQFVKEMGMQPILWDDMFRQVDEEMIRASPLVKLVEIMVWNYGKTVNLAGVLGKYVSAGFPGVWIASAFKGASGPASQLPYMRLHLLNHYSWAQLLRQFANKIAFRGIAITGWQRFDHFGTLCELFPVGVPALAVSLGYLQLGRVDDKVLDEINAVLKCNMRLPAFDEVDDSMTYLMCEYPGSQVLTNVLLWWRLVQAKEQLMATNQYQGWLTEPNRKQRFSSPEHVKQCTQEVPSLIASCDQLRQSMISSLTKVADKHTALEWVATFIQPLQIWFEKLQADVEDILAKKDWPRRPTFGTTN